VSTPNWQVRTLAALVIAGAAALAGLAAVVPAMAQSRQEQRARVGGWLAEALRASLRGDGKALEAAAEQGQVQLDGHAGPLDAADLRWRIQCHLQPGSKADEVADAALTRLGGRVAARGWDLLDVWLPLRQLPALLQAEPRIAFAQLPQRPVLLQGPVMSAGAELLRSPQLACAAATGLGQTVAVLDGGFEGLDKALQAGELAQLVGPIPQGEGTHGTMCAEVVADVAPGAAILPLRASSIADLQALAKEITLQGNPRQIAVVSHSVIWLGQSFGRHDGKVCEVTDAVRSAGVAWVNASGNSGAGEFYRAAFVDLDNDGLHEFAAGQEKLLFYQYGGQLQLTLDWDDYEARKVNLDFELLRQEELPQGGAQWQLVASSKMVAGKYIAPMEQLVHSPKAAGSYAVQVRALGKVPAGMRLRIVSMGHGTGNLSIWHKNGNVYDPASCDGVLTVGALAAAQYSQGPLESYSSYGPTADGRIKPEVVAPTQVATSQGFFAGTSAACPHAAGAVAVWAAATGQPPDQVAQLMRQHAVAMGDSLPDDAYGWGRIALPPAELGWDCSATDLPGAQTCATACGSVGSRTCGETCAWSSCAPPQESCNGQDDDCDGLTDDGLPACAAIGADAKGEVSADAGAPTEVAGDSSAKSTPAAPPVAQDQGCRAGSGPSRGGIALLAAVAAMAVALRRKRGRILS
jgi:subtilisin family serine protease